jgi:hypothetical protein
MKKSLWLAVLVLGAALSACGGGSGGTSAPAVAATQPPSVATVALPVFLNPTTLTGAAVDVSLSGGTWLVVPTGAGNVTVSSQGSTLKIADNGAVGVMSVSGSGNNIIFSATATVSSLTITGKTNTVYLPEGSKITVANASGMDVSNVVKFYKP